MKPPWVPRTAVETYASGENGNRTATADPEGRTVTASYDALDRETLRTSPHCRGSR